MQKTRFTLSILTSLLGLAHVGFTPVFFHGINLGALWFLGSGLTLVFLGVANLLLIGRAERWVHWTGVATNTLVLAFVTTIAGLLKAPQAFAGLGLVLGLFALGLKRRG